MQNITTEPIGWGNLTSPDSDMSIAVVTINTIRILFGLLAIGGNLLIILCVVQYKTLRTTTNLVIGNLAAANFSDGCVTLWNALTLLSSCSGPSPASVTVEIIRRVLSLYVFFGNNVAIFAYCCRTFSLSQTCLTIQQHCHDTAHSDLHSFHMDLLRGSVCWSSCEKFPSTFLFGKWHLRSLFVFVHCICRIQEIERGRPSPASHTWNNSRTVGQPKGSMENH